MDRIAHDTGIVETTPQDFPVLAVNVLDRLGYRVSRASKQLDQILAVERVEEQYGRDWWRHEYRVVLRWSETGQNAVLAELEISEHKGGGTVEDCERRCSEVIRKLQDDALRAKHVAARKPKPTMHGAAAWGDEQALRKTGYISNKPQPTRLILGKTKQGEYISVPELVTNAHAIVCGRTGVGKSRGFFIPQLIERLGSSMIVTEATPGFERGELYKLTAGWRKMAGHHIYCFNPADMTSHRINPIDRVRWAPDDMKSAMAEKLADLVIQNGESTEARYEQTWNRSEKLLLIPLILHAAASDPKLGHFGAVRWLLLMGPDRLTKVLRDSPSERAQMEFEGWLELAGQTDFRYGVFSGLLTKLNPWLTDQMVTLTETTDIDLDALKNQLFTFYLCVPSRSRDSKLIGSLMLNFLLDLILEIREEMKHPMAMLLDEFSNFGRIAGIGDTLSIIRKNRIGLLLGFQNYNQLEQVYNRKEAQIIIDMPATQVYFKQKNFREARELSEALGRTTVEDVTVNDTGRVQEFIQGRALATPDELINLNGEVIVFTNDTSPLKLAITPPDAYQQALQYLPPERPKHQISENTRRRGKSAEQQTKPEESSEKPEPATEDRRRSQKDRKRKDRPIEDKPQDNDGNPSRTTLGTDSPEVDDIWPL